MGKKSIIAVIFCCVATLLIGADLPEEEVLHGHSVQCQESTKVTCLYQCETCHGESGQPDNPANLEKGDIELCTQCHKWEKRKPGEPRGDCIYEMHRENIEYNDLENPRLMLREKPIGIQLYCDKDRYKCKVFCVSCHNPMQKPDERSSLSELAISYCHRCHDNPLGEKTRKPSKESKTLERDLLRDDYR